MKLDKLPDRTPVKLAVSFSPEHHADLVRYTELYAETYGEPVAAAELVPFIVRAFLTGDKDFKRAKKGADTPPKNGKRGAA